MMYILFFYFCSSLCLYEIFLRKKEFDLFSVYMISLILFCLPLFFMKAYNPISGDYVVPERGTYIIYGIAFLFAYIFSALDQYSFSRITIIRKANGIHFGRNNKSFLFVIFIICLIMFLSILPSLILADSKQQALETGGMEMMLMSSLVPIGFSYAVISKEKKYVSIFAIMAVTIFFFGTRSPIVFCALAWAVLISRGKKTILIKQYKLIFCLFVALLLVILGKSFYGVLIRGGGVGDWLSGLTFDKIVIGAEFLRTNGILNTVVKENFNIPYWSVPVGVLSILPMPLDWFGLSSSLFNDLFQPKLFPDIEYGMAYNPWAEAYSWLGFFGVVLYSLSIPAFLFCIKKIFSHDSTPAGAIFLIIGIVLAFWVHRNSFSTSLAYTRNMLYPAVGLYIFSVAIRDLKAPSK